LSVALRLPGGDGEALHCEGERLAMVSPKAFAPGQPIAFDAMLADGTLSLEGRSLGSKRRPDGRFDVRVRLINLSRHGRERLVRALAE
jgi:hypothetical protein